MQVKYSEKGELFSKHCKFDSLIDQLDHLLLVQKVPSYPGLQLHLNVGCIGSLTHVPALQLIPEQ